MELPPGLLLLLPMLPPLMAAALLTSALLLAAISAAAAATSDGELQLTLLLLVLLLVWLLLTLLALETCVSGSVCCNNSVLILTVCCSIPLEIPAIAGTPAVPLLVMALTAADVGLLLVTPLLLTTALIEDIDVGGGAPGGTPNTDGELYWLTVWKEGTFRSDCELAS